MRLRTLTNLTTFLLLAISCALVAAMHWGMQRLNYPYELMRHHDALTQVVQGELRSELENYLRSGDAGALSRAEALIQEAATRHVAALPAGVATRVEGPLQRVAEFLRGDLRASGKLSGDPQALLRHAERELRNNAAALLDYAQEGAHGHPGASRYVPLVGRIMTELHGLSDARERYFDTADDAYLRAVSASLDRMRNLHRELAQLPRLGVMDTALEEDVGALLRGEEPQVSQVDRAERVLGELASVLNRYPRDLEVTRVNRQHTAAAHQHARSLLRQLDQETASLLSDVERFYRDTTSDVRWMVLLLIAGLAGVVWSVDRSQRRVSRTVQTLAQQLEAYADGDFRQPMFVTGRLSELRSLAHSGDRLQQQMTLLIGALSRQSHAVHGASRTLAASADDIVEGSKRQEHEHSAGAAAVTELNASFREVASSAAATAEAASVADEVGRGAGIQAQQALAQFEALRRDVSATAESLQSLDDQSQQVETVLTVIANVADQTNLLALNAAIEAARAGASGRGFAVVAAEVRDLARRTSESTEEIRAIVEGLHACAGASRARAEGAVSAADTAAKQVQGMAQSLQRIGTALGDIRSRNDAVAEATGQQSAAVEEVDANLSAMQSLNHSNSEAAEKVLNQTRDLERLSLELRELVARFKIPRAQIDASAGAIAG